MNDLRVVLVEPQIPANLGFVARILDNFGVEDWVAVEGCAVEGTEAERTGAPARERLHALRRVGSLEEALADCSASIGLTARGGHRRHPLALDGLRTEMDGSAVDGRIAFVFGREDRGLEARECEACTHLVRIPTAGFSSLNLSHAVGITLYEWFRGRLETPEEILEHQWSSHEERQKMAERTLRALEAGEFRHHGDQLTGALRRLVAKPMESRDLRVLNKILRHVEYRGSDKISEAADQNPQAD